MVFRIARLIVAALFLTATVPAGGLAQEVTPGPPAVGCSWAPKPPGPVAVETDDDEEEDGEDEEEDDEEEANEPKIVGSVPAPPRGQRSRAALAALATVTRDAAVQIAWTAIPDPDRRRMRGAELGIEHGYVVWEVEFGYRPGESGPDREIEVYVDVGDGRVLMIECEH